MPIATVNVVPPGGLNTRLYLDINRFAQRTSWAHGFMHAWALWAGLVVMALLVVAAYLTGRRSSAAPRAVAACGLTALAAVAALGLNQAVGHAVGELRPYATHPHVLVLVGKGTDFSFPSDHSTAAGAIAAGLFAVSWRWGLLGSVLALFLGFARLYVGAHYPGDVVAGLLLGALVAVLFDAVLLRHLTRLTNWMASTVLAPLVRARPGVATAG